MPAGLKKIFKIQGFAWDLRGQVTFTYGPIQKTQNPTVRHILEWPKNLKVL